MPCEQICWCLKGLPVVHAKEAVNKTSLHPKHCVSLISSYLDHTHTPKSECMYKVTVHATPLAWFTLLHVCTCTCTWFTQQTEKALWSSEGTQCTAHTPFLSFPCFMCAGKSYVTLWLIQWQLGSIWRHDCPPVAFTTCITGHRIFRLVQLIDFCHHFLIQCVKLWGVARTDEPGLAEAPSRVSSHCWCSVTIFKCDCSNANA